MDSKFWVRIRFSSQASNSLHKVQGSLPSIMLGSQGVSMILRSQVSSDLLLCHPQCEVSTLRSMVVAQPHFHYSQQDGGRWEKKSKTPSLRVCHLDVVPPIDQNLATGSYLLQGSLGEVVLILSNQVPN